MNFKQKGALLSLGVAVLLGGVYAQSATRVMEYKGGFLSTCKLQVSFNESDGVDYVAASDSRTVFSGHFPTIAGELYLTKRREYRPLVLVDGEDKPIESLTIKFEENEKGEVVPVSYVHDNSLFMHARGNHFYQPKTCANLK